MFNIGIIGCGNMGYAISKAVLNSDKISLYISNRGQEKLQKVVNELNAIKSSNLEIFEKCDFVFLTVKPNIIKNVLQEANEIINRRGSDLVIVSTAAGVSINDIISVIGEKSIIRIMPNTPINIGKGIILYCYKNISEKQKETFVNLINYSGFIDEIDECLIDAASAITGCGPAFAYMFIDAIADGGVSCGLPREKAITYASKMLEGSASMVFETKLHPDKLKDDVCSPGGSTIEGVITLENNSFRSAVSSSIISSYKKTKLLGK